MHVYVSYFNHIVYFEQLTRFPSVCFNPFASTNSMVTEPTKISTWALTGIRFPSLVTHRKSWLSFRNIRPGLISGLNLIHSNSPNEVLIFSMPIYFTPNCATSSFKKYVILNESPFFTEDRSRLREK